MLIEELKRRWWMRVSASNLQNSEVTVKVRGLSPEEAIGKPAQADYPLYKGCEVMIQAEFRGALGQAYTDEPCHYKGRLKDIQRLELYTNRDRALFIAIANATYKWFGLVTNTTHCKNEGPEICGRKIAEYLASDAPSQAKVLMIGFQPAIAYHLSKNFEKFRVTDMDPANIGQVRRGVLIEPYERNREAINWSDIILATGSTIVNNTIDEIISLCRGKKLIFYGVTIASAAYEFSLKRLCFTS